ncbi:hypothetical protein CVT25_005606 [Psilocybe cyanescens]|uniref:BZIP domain-containing protein n=1 Tax=Psilocybe cyanescens TaxID=93625 RepID=A0A409VV25_PSICY|nr:hypothetical protein CVT25_005606 [Psilocybe cyanescens]
MQMASATAMFARESTGSTSPAAVLNEAYQMEVDSRESPTREAQLPSYPSVVNDSSLSNERAPVANADFMDKELIPPTSRLSRLPHKVPSSPQTTPDHTDPVAISAYQNNTTSYTSQDVHHFVNSSASLTPSTATRTSGQQSTPPETSVSSFSQPLQHHVLTHPIRRPRTSNTIFQSSTDLAAHYGIPQILPPAPRTTPRNTAPAYKESDFDTLKNAYITMLSDKPTDNSVAAPSAPQMSSTIASSGLDAPDTMTDAQLRDIATILGKDTASYFSVSLTHYIGTACTASSPEFRDQDYFDTFMSTSPLMPELDEFGTSPLETPYSDFLTTPLFSDDALLTSPNMEDYMNMPLFPSITDEQEVPIQSKAPAPVFENLYTISPTTPAIESFDSFDPAQLYKPGSVSTTHSDSSADYTAGAPAPTRRVKATGIRKGVTPDSLLDEKAPTQPRKYTTPSVTSRKEVPAVFARKRLHSVAFGEEQDQLDQHPPDEKEADLIEAKRRQNTVAARRSRKRKLERVQNMEKSRDEERALKEIWQERANFFLGLARSHGHVYPDFPPDERQYADV